MTRSSMRCASKAATDAAARIREVGYQASPDSASGYPSPEAAGEQTATSDVAGARDYPRVAS